MTSRLGLQLKDAQGRVLDGVFLDIDAMNNANIDEGDIQKLQNLDESLSLEQSGTQFTLLKNALPQDGAVVPLHLINYRQSQYAFEVGNVPAITDFETVLVDQFANTATVLQTGHSITFNIDTSQPASSAADRFYLQFNNVTLGTDGARFNTQIGVYPNPAVGGAFTVTLPAAVPAKLELINMLGQQVWQGSINGTTRVEVPQAAPGLHLLRVTTQYGHTSLKVQIR